MKKFFSILVIMLLSVASIFGLFACDSPKNTETESGLKMYLVDSVDEPYYVVSDYVCDGETTKLEIPEQKNGYPVKEIKSGAFLGNDVLTEIVVPTSVTTINEGAFAGIKKLTKLTIPFIGKTANSDAYVNESDGATDKSVGVERTLGYIFGTESFNYGVQITSNYNEGDSDSRTYYFPMYLTEITVATDNEYSIPMYAFYGNTVIKKINLVGTIDKIGDYAFSGCETLNSFTVQSSVSYIGKYAFNNAKSLTDDGFSFEQSDVELIIGDYAFYGIGVKNLTVPARTVRMGDYAFSASNVENLFVSTEKIANYAFKDCTNLKTVVIADTVKEIGVYSFDGCNTLSIFGKSGVSGANKIDLTGIEKLGGMSFANLNPNATFTVISTLSTETINNAFYKTKIA